MSAFQLELDIYCNDEEKLNKAVSLLSDWGCCNFCIIRFLSEKQQYIYRKDNKALDEWVEYCKQETNGTSDDKETVVQDTKEKVCTACLGVLQDEFSSDAFLKKLGEVSAEHDHEFDDYFASLTVPVVLIIREYSLWLCLKDIFPEVFSLSRKDDITPIKDVWKWINGQPLGNIVGKPFDVRSPYEIAVFFTHKENDQECNFLYTVDEETFRKRKIHKKREQSMFTRINVMNALGSISQDKFKKYYQCPPKVLSTPAECDKITCNHEAVFVAGRYNKYNRTLSQTPWVIEGVRKSESSIEELACDHVKDKFKAAEFRFSSSGREDVDVQMLGTGRPYLMEIINPHRTKFTPEQMKEMQNHINNNKDGVAVRDLQIVTREDTTNLKDGEQEKTKAYTATCWAATPITQDMLDKVQAQKDLVLKQKTPIRVLHRRPLAVRERTVHHMTATREDTQHFKLTLSTQAGTYIKEFVHGDFGRTKPSLGELLGVDCDILTLDVDGVELDWPPKIDDY